MKLVNIESLEVITLDQFKRDNQHISLPQTISDDILKELGYALLYNMPTHLTPILGPYEYLVESTPIIIDGKYHINFEKFSLIPTAEPEITIFIENEKNKLKQVIAQKRWEKEVSGIVLHNGQVIKTDRESQAQLNGAITGFKNGFIDSTWWKSENGWDLITLESALQIAQMVAVHVKQCFTEEKEQVEILDSITTVDELLQFIKNNR